MLGETVAVVPAAVKWLMIVAKAMQPHITVQRSETPLKVQSSIDHARTVSAPQQPAQPMDHLIGRFGSDGGGTNSKTRPAHIWPCTFAKVWVRLQAGQCSSDLVCFMLESFQANARHRLVLVLLSMRGSHRESKPRFNQISCTA